MIQVTPAVRCVSTSSYFFLHIVSSGALLPVLATHSFCQFSPSGLSQLVSPTDGASHHHIFDPKHYGLTSHRLQPAHNNSFSWHSCNILSNDAGQVFPCLCLIVTACFPCQQHGGMLLIKREREKHKDKEKGRESDRQIVDR